MTPQTPASLPATVLLLALVAAAGCGGEEVLRRGSVDEARARAAAARERAGRGAPAPAVELETQAGTLRDYPDRVRREGGVWLGVCSSAPRKHGGDREALRGAVEAWGFTHPVLLDPDGAVGRRFDATHTPQVFLLDERGVLRYVGAVDNQPFSQLRDGRPVEPAVRQAYGSRVKYAQRPLAE